MPTPIQENLVDRNQEYAADFKDGHLDLPPAKKYAVVTCMDARIDPASAFGISLGDAHVIRNAGGSSHEALRSLVISEQLLGTTEIVLIKHTGCGMLTFSNQDAHGVVAQNLGAEGEAELDGLDFLPFENLEQGVKDDVAFLKGSKAIPDFVSVSGWIYEVETGKVKPVL
ncbi:carbonate dehydratase [Physcia stellaris]|nr:carbonate dehydratase [Physcia stellaris]